MLEAVVFDFDGLILDTETPEFESWADIYREFGVTLHLETWATCIGTDASAFDPYDHLEALVGKPVNRVEVRDRRLQKYQTLVAGADLRPGVRDYLKDAHAMGLKIGLASSSSWDWVVPHLERYQIRSYFDCICVRDHVQKVKPDPALYLRALNRLGVQPEQAVAFEDSPNGASAAKCAGMHCVIVPNQMTKDLTFPDVDYRLDSMDAMRLDALARTMRLLG
ncbi:MAG: HAD family hydrolase [Alicyclobacillus sp.]|nr:HAD family hydrolase [Alicyclobacillus sp.]